MSSKSKHHYAVESPMGIASNGRRFCARYMRFVTAKQRDEWVVASEGRFAIKSSDSDMNHDVRASASGWQFCCSGGEWLL